MIPCHHAGLCWPEVCLVPTLAVFTQGLVQLASVSGYVGNKHRHLFIRKVFKSPRVQAEQPEDMLGKKKEKLKTLSS